MNNKLSLSSKTSQIELDFWLDLSSFFGSSNEPSQPFSTTELERAEPKSYQKFPSSSEPSQRVWVRMSSPSEPSWLELGRLEPKFEPSHGSFHL